MASQVRTIPQLRARVAGDATLRDELSRDPEGVLARFDSAPVPDTWIYRIVVGSLGLVILVCAVGAIYLALPPAEKDVPDLLVALGSAAVGALAGLLAPSPARS